MLVSGRFLTYILIGFIYLGGVPVVWAMEASPAGGDYLYFPEGKAFGLVPHETVLIRDFKEGITLDGWIFFEKFPEQKQAFMLIQKPEAFQLILQGRKSEDVFLQGHARWTERGGRDGGGRSRGQAYTLKLNTWYYFYLQFEGKEEDLSNETDSPVFIGAKRSDFDFLEPIDPILELVLEYIPFVGGIDELRISNTIRYPQQGREIFIGNSPLDEGAPPVIPQAVFEPDANTIALWHFDSPVHFFTDAQNSLVIQPHGGLKNTFPVERQQTQAILWGHLKSMSNVW